MKIAAYENYKPSNIGWVRDIPAHWELKRLKYVASRSEVKVEADEDSPLPYIGLEHVEPWTGRLLPLDEDLVPTGVSNRFESGDTLFGKLRPYLAKACNVDFQGLCSSELLVLRGKTYDRGFLLYQLLSHGFINLVDSSTYGSKMPRASWDFIGICELPLPPLDEQQTIARFLDAQTARIDTLVAKKRQLIAKLKEKRSALIARTVTRGLPPNASKAAGLEPNPEVKDSGFEWIGKIPKHWEARRMKNFGDLVAGAGFPHEFQGQEDEELTFYKVGDLANAIDGKTMGDSEHTISRQTARLLRAKVIPIGAVVYAKIGAALLLNRRRITARNCCIDNNMTAFIPKPQCIDTLWAYYWLSTLDFGEFTNPGAIPSLSEGYQAELPFLAPPLAEQKLICSFLDRETSVLDQLTNKVEAAMDRLTEYRQALITSAVTGKIDVREVAA